MRLKFIRHPASIGAAMLAAVALACQGGEPRSRAPSTAAGAPAAAAPIPRSEPLPSGTYEVQNVRYDDATGSYQIFLFGVPAGRKPLFQHTDVQLARLTDDEIAAGKKAYFEVQPEGAQVLHLPADFAIDYVHNVTQEVTNPSTGQPETVIVRQETSSWSPFISAMAGAALGNMLFAPRYYYPPPYSPGGLTGFGGVGTTRELASQAYSQRHGSPPKAATVSRTGMAPRKVGADGLRGSGQGAGASRWQKPSSPSPSRKSPGFGGGGFGRGRRR